MNAFNKKSNYTSVVLYYHKLRIIPLQNHEYARFLPEEKKNTKNLKHDMYIHKQEM